jgi:hypothetical protein
MEKAHLQWERIRPSFREKQGPRNLMKEKRECCFEYLIPAVPEIACKLLSHINYLISLFIQTNHFTTLEESIDKQKE